MMHLWMHATLEEAIVYIPTFSISFSPIVLVLTRWVMKAESRARSLSTWILWLNMEMYIDHPGPKLIFLYWATHSEQEGVEQDHGFAQSALQPVHRGCSCFLGTKWDGTSIWSKCWPKPMLWLQHLYDYSCFYVDLIKTGPFTKDLGFYIVVERDGDKPERCLVCKLAL